MTVDQAAKTFGTCNRTIRNWIRDGKIPATLVLTDSNRMAYHIPDGTPCPQKKEGGGRPVLSPAAEQRIFLKKGKRAYVAKYAGVFTIGHIAQFLGIASDEVRWIYDDILAKGGF
jgi:hypothetical protein